MRALSRLAVGYLTGPEAMDVARMTGLGLSSSLHKLWEAGDIAPDAVRATDHVFLDLTRLSWWDRLRVAWVRIGAHCVLDQPKEAPSGRGDSCDSVDTTSGCGVEAAEMMPWCPDTQYPSLSWP